MYCVNGAEILTNRAAVAIILDVAHMMMVIAITEKGKNKIPFIDEDSLYENIEEKYKTIF